MSLGILRDIGIILFLYLTWRNLRENYKEDRLIVFGWTSILVFLISGRLIFGLLNWGVWQNWTDWLAVWTKPGFNLLGAYLSLIGVSWIIARKEGWKLWPLMEDLWGSLLILLIFILADEFFRTRFDLLTGLYALVLVIGYIIGFIIKPRYRSWVWYHSGKKGFVFFFINALIFFMLSLLSWWFKSGIPTEIGFAALGLISVISLLTLGNVFEPLTVNLKRSRNDRTKENE
jgi:hypothetical protein